MSEYSDQWRERKRYRKSQECSPCLCGRRLTRTQKQCIWCESPNPEYRAKDQTQ